MNNAERFLRYMHFQSVDHPPLMLDGPWEETWDRWHAEGLPEGVSLNEYFEVEPAGTVYAGLPTRLFPPFEETILEENDEYTIYIDRDGVKVQKLREAKASGAEHYLEFPVKGSADKAWLAEKLNPDDPRRYAEGWQEKVLQWKDHPSLLPLLDFGSFYGELRDMMGTEAVSYIFYDDPEFVHWFNDRVAACCERVMEAVFPLGIIKIMGGSEDCAFKNGPLISPDAFREFMMPYYRRTVGLARKHGMDIFIVDSDGDIRSLIPLWLEVGVNCVLPLEVAAGMDVVELRKEYGHDLLMIGGLDKRAFAHSKEAIREEVMMKVPPLIAEGGYIPKFDHGVPPDVPFEHYRYYVQLMKELYGMA
ncbi:MAG: uroporphyrinogen decarboxylase family protein [Armatimonadota bacterium]